MRGHVRLRFLIVLALLIPYGRAQSRSAHDEKIEARVNRILAKMTLEEKVGQLNQYNFDKENIEAEIAAGKVGSILNGTGAEQVNRLQRIAIEKSRLHIPILFGYDVIHGYSTIFPIPLGIASSWDRSAIERMARVSAREASSAGIRWTFSPMVDIARDPRWGRIAEGAGEDTYLGGEVAAAYVRGYQGTDLTASTSIAACAKHYVGYGAAEGGRDYDSVDMSERKLRETYLPPFKASVDAGALTFMSSFNTLNGIPASANPYTLRRILKQEWGFKGFVVSDWNSIGELVPHGVAADKNAAAEKALKAGVDMDMTSDAYIIHLAELTRKGKVPQLLINDAVKRILRVKIQLGLFENPYTETGLEAQRLLSQENRKAAREVAQKSMVLLKNDGNVLPFSKAVRSFAVIGPLADSKIDMLGNWYGKGDARDVVTVLEAVRTQVGDPARVLYSKAGDVLATSDQELEEAVATARQADAVLLVLGEKGSMSGEAASRSELNLPGDQQKLLEAVVGTGKPVALVLMNGRPLTLSWAAEHVPAILEAWFPGTEGGNAVADVVFGDVNPSGKLPVTFPRNVGQVPIYYSSLSTGRPAGPDADKRYYSGYIDVARTPLFPFGFGLSYTKFKISDLRVSAPDPRGSVRVTVDATNIGDRAGDEIVQVYAHASRGAVARPVKELRAFERVSLAAGQTKSVQFAIPRAEFATWKSNTQYEVQSGRFTLLVGSSSETVLSGSFDLSNPRSQVAKRHTAQPVSKRTPQTTKKATPQSSQPLGVLPGAAN
jgi:beta-glucosidase